MHHLISRLIATLLPPRGKHRKGTADAPPAATLPTSPPHARRWAPIDGDSTAIVRPYLIAYERRLVGVAQ
jgi:hypothetical protein